MPEGNRWGSATMRPWPSRLTCQQSSITRYWYPASFMPVETRASAVALSRDSLTLQPNLFQLFQPMGGVAARPSAARAGAPARRRRPTSSMRIRSSAWTSMATSVGTHFDHAPELLEALLAARVQLLHPHGLALLPRVPGALVEREQVEIGRVVLRLQAERLPQVLLRLLHLAPPEAHEAPLRPGVGVGRLEI